MSNPLDSAPLCPTCHSKVSPSGNRKQGIDGEDSNFVSVPVWSNDPILTPEGFNGDRFKGTQFIDVKSILEIQTNRTALETELGIAPLTEFTPVTKDTGLIQAAHINQLRISTERILNFLGVSLEDYFKLDEDGNPQPPGPHDVPNKQEWTDVVRGLKVNTTNLNSDILSNDNTTFFVNNSTLEPIPTLPTDISFIKAIHVEDLRHPIPQKVLIEVFSVANDAGTSISSPTIDPYSPSCFLFTDGFVFNGAIGQGSDTVPSFPIQSDRMGIININPFTFLTSIRNRIDLATPFTCTPANTPTSFSRFDINVVPSGIPVSSGTAHKIVIDLSLQSTSFDLTVLPSPNHPGPGTPDITTLQTPSEAQFRIDSTQFSLESNGGLHSIGNTYSQSIPTEYTGTQEYFDRFISLSLNALSIHIEFEGWRISNAKKEIFMSVTSNGNSNISKVVPNPLLPPQDPAYVVPLGYIIFTLNDPLTESFQYKFAIEFYQQTPSEILQVLNPNIVGGSNTLDFYTITNPADRFFGHRAMRITG